jgi:Flp pilus assembly protein CpaB
MPDQNDNPLAFEPINEPIIISKVNNENEQNTLSEMLNRQKKSYDDI